MINLIKKKLSKQDNEFFQKTKAIKCSDLNPTNFGAQKAFENFVIPSELIEQFSQIDNQITPLAKLNCMRKTLDTINDCLKKTVDECKSPLENYRQTVYIMSDDLIASVICILATCKPAYFCSNIEFIHSFSWYLPQNSELGYSLVTFEVAKEYIQNQIDQKNLRLNQTGFPNIETKQTVKNSEFSHLDYEIEKITKMLNNSDIQTREINSFPKKDNEELG